MGLKGSKAPYRISTAAAGFVAGFAVTVMLFTAHQKHRWAARRPPVLVGGATPAPLFRPTIRLARMLARGLG